MSGERFAPAFSVEVNGVGLKADAAGLTELSVTQQPDTIDGCVLTLANPQPEMRWTHSPRDADFFDEGYRLTVKLGYGNALRQVFDGEITAISPTFPESGTPTVRIEGYTRMHRLRAAPKTRTFLGMTDSNIADRVAHDLKLNLESDNTEVSHDYVIQFNQTDLAFLLERAQRIGYEVSVSGHTLRFKHAGDSQTPALTLVYGGAAEDPADAADAHPLHSFSPRMNFLRPVDHVIVRGHHPKTWKPIEARADARATLGGKPKRSDRAKAAFGAQEQTVVDRPVASVAEAQQLADELYVGRALEFVTGNGTTIGIPEMAAGSVVRLLGLGRFSGSYYVTQCTHTIGASGFHTSFSARSARS